MAFAEAMAQKGNSMTMTMTMNNVTANTHGGVFHADEVFATAVLKQLFENLTVHRVFRPEDDADIVYDIGGGAYDHHQADKETRPDGIPYAAFGLIWRSFGRAYIESLGVFTKYVDFVHAMVDKTLVRSVDALDNGVSLGGEAFTISDAISSFNPEWDSDESADEAFSCAVDFAGSVLMLQVRHAWGLRGEELAKASGIDDAIFVHPAGFIGASASLGGARVLAWLGLEATSDTDN